MLPFASQQQPQAQACFSRLLDACGAHSHPGSPAMPTSLLLVNCAENRSIATIPSLTEHFINYWLFLKKGCRFWAPRLWTKPQAAPKYGPLSGPSFFSAFNRRTPFFSTLVCKMMTGWCGCGLVLTFNCWTMFLSLYGWYPF
jgi:hypothetical protein